MIKNIIILLNIIFLMSCAQKVEFLVKKPPKYDLPDKVQFFEIGAINSGEKIIETKQFLREDITKLEQLSPKIPAQLNHNSNFYEDHLKSAILSELSQSQKYQILRDSENTQIYGVRPPEEQIVKIDIDFTGYAESFYDSENLSYALAIKKGNLPLMDTFQIEGMTYIVIKGLESNKTGFKVDTSYIEKVYALQAIVTFKVGKKQIGTDKFYAFYIKKIGGQQDTVFTSLTSHVDSQIRSGLVGEKSHFNEFIGDVDKLKLAMNDPELYLSMGYNLKNDPGVQNTNKYIISSLSHLVAKEIVANLEGKDTFVDLSLASGDSYAINLINGNAYEEAINYLEGLNNRSDADTLNLAISYEAIGNRRQALKYYEQAASMNSSFQSNLLDANRRLKI